MISQTTEYALRIVVYLASLHGKPATTAQIAMATSVPQQYLAKILRNLARGGLVKSQRGLGGGSVLSRSPDEMTVYDVVQVVEPIERIRVCPLGLKTHTVKLCPLHHKIDQAMGLVETNFRATKISEVVAEPDRPTPLIDGKIVPASGLVAARVLRKATAK